MAQQPYKTICPNKTCQGHNFYVTPHNGFGYCFNCGYHEKDNDIDDIPREISPNVDEIRALYTQAANYYHSALDTRAYAFLQQRGFTDSTIQQLKIGYCPIGTSPMYKGLIAKDAGLIHYDKTAFLGDRITFPYFNENGIVTDIRGRSLDPYEELKYKSLLGSSYYRGAIYPYNYHLSNNKKILLTEGEIKADIAVQSGYPTMAFPGITNWRIGFIPNPTIEYTLVYDSQVNGYHYIQQAIIKIARKIHNLKIATLPLLGRLKMDIDTFILEYGINAFKMIINGALPYKEWYVLQRF